MKAKKKAEDMSRFASIVVDATRDLQWNRSTVYTNPGGAPASATSPPAEGAPAIPSLVPLELGSSSDPEWERWQKKEWARFVAARNLREARKAGLRNRSLYSIREDAYPTYEESKPTRDLLEYQRHAYNRLSAHLDKTIQDGDLPTHKDNDKKSKQKGSNDDDEAVMWDEGGLTLFKLLFGRETKARPAPVAKNDNESSSDSSSSDSEEDDERMKMLQQAITVVTPTQWTLYDDDAKKTKKKKKKKEKKDASETKQKVAMTDEEKKKLEEDRKERKKLKRQRQKQKKKEEEEKLGKKRKTVESGEATKKSSSSSDSESDDEEEKQERKKKKRKTEKDDDKKEKKEKKEKKKAKKEKKDKKSSRE